MLDNISYLLRNHVVERRGAILHISQANLSVNGIRQGTTMQGQIDNDTEQFSQLYRETAIKLEIASKVSKLPNPNVWVNPKAITRMAKDEKFYDKVMSKINAFTSDPNISLNYPHITYSLVVEEDGDWVETMVNEDLKKLAEEAEKNDDKSKSIFDMLETTNPLLTATQYNLPIDVIYDYSNIPVDFKKKKST
jgi:hypothetical protein